MAEQLVFGLATADSPDYGDIRRWFTTSPDDPDGIWHRWPMEGVTCGACGTDGCLMYPDPGDDESAPQMHRPSTICPQCSTAGAELFLRFCAGRKGYTLKPISVFGITRPAPIQSMQELLDRAEPECRASLAECWEATEGGSDWTSDFERGEDGRLIYRDGGPRPSFALACLFDVERHLRGESTALIWAGEAVA